MVSKNKLKSKKSKIGICSYHLCKKQSRVYQCEYCGEYFCEKHINPKPVGLPRFRSSDPEDLLFMYEWRKPGHPCMPYYSAWKEKIKKMEEKYKENLYKLLEKKEDIDSEYVKNNIWFRGGNYNNYVIDNKVNKIDLRNTLFVILYIIILLTIIIFMTSFYLNH